MTHLPDTLNCDAAPYPDDAILEQIRTADSVETTFPKLAAELAPYSLCELSDDDEYHIITFVTGGWSGCEDFIGAVLGNMMLRVMYYSAWKRGGWHEFRVPRDAVK